MGPISVVAALDDPHRARLYEVVRDAGGAVTREEAGAAVGISRKLAAFHLDRLVEAGLLEASHDRTRSDVRSIGRTPKRYRTRDVDVSVSIPERRYDLVGEILVDAVAAADKGEDAHAAAERIGYERGRALGATTRASQRLGRLGPERAERVVVEILRGVGFEPATVDAGIVQRNCPFDRLAQRQREIVCGINRSFVAGLLDGLAVTKFTARLAPEPKRCCVVVAPA